MTKRYMEKNAVKANIPVDINGVGLTGSRIGMSQGYKLAITINTSAAASNLDVTINQHDAAAAGNSKVLTISNSYFTKVAAETVFTQKDLAAVSNIVDADFNAAAGYMVIEINAEDLDTNGGFGFVSADIASPGAIAQVVSMEYVLHDVRSEAAYEVSI